MYMFYGCTLHALAALYRVKFAFPTVNTTIVIFWKQDKAKVIQASHSDVVKQLSRGTYW